MIIVRSPLRISLGGGGTDLPSYYREHTGFVIAAAIDKYVYTTLHETFLQKLAVRYSKMELVQHIDEVQHPIVREVLRLMGIHRPCLDLAFMADVPAGTGLGSSGSFTTALLRALHGYQRIFISPQRLARKACEVEIDILKEPVGKQDPYIAACGGVTHFTFRPDDEVDVSPVELDPHSLANLEENLLLFYTGVSRSASEILVDQDIRTKQKDGDMIANLHFVKQLGYESKTALESGDLRKFADLMHVHWEHKKKRSPGMSSESINEWYELARREGAIGGKLIGAGGGGFLVFYVENNKEPVRAAMQKVGLREVRFRFDFQGTTVIAQS